MTDHDRDPFTVARRWAGSACILAGIVFGLIDALTLTYALDPISFGLLMGTGAILLGVEPVINRFK